MRTPEDPDPRRDPELGALASLPLPDLRPEGAALLRARCRAALEARGGRGGSWAALCDRVLVPAAAAILGGGVLLATAVRAAAILAAAVA